MKEVPQNAEHRERLRERFRSAGGKGLSDYELVELLLTYAIPRKDVKPEAKRLIKRFGSLGGVLDASVEHLEEVAGVGPSSATLVRLVRELLSAYMAEGMSKRDVVSSPHAVIDFAQARLSGLPHEAFMVVYLNAKNEVLEHEVLNEGIVDRTVVYPRRVIEGALAHHAAALVLVHNHPSGHSDPSPEDKRLTRSICEAARTFDIRIVDHIIVAKGGYFSFAQSGELFPAS